MKQQNKSHIISRYVLVIIGIMLLVCGIIYKLVDTTVVHRVDWNKKADKILTKVDIVPPERGNIYASNGTLLAGNLHYYTARLDWGVKCVERPDSINKYMGALCDSLASMFPEKDAKYWEKSFRVQMERPKRKRSYRIASKLTFSEYQRLKKFPFFNIRKNRNFLYSEMDTIRIKPYGKMASRSIGGVAEIKGDTVNVERNGFVHGISGLEMALDSLLYGKPGKAQKIQLTNKMASYATIPAERGYDIKTTIDVEIQDIVEEELYNMCVESKAEWGTAILMEVKSGEIKAISNLEWNKNARDYVEGTNHAVLGYEPGSVMKPISMLVALEKGIVTNIDQVITTGHSWAYAGGRPISDGHGAASMPVREIIERSSNVGMARLITRYFEKQPDMFRQSLAELGFFDSLKTGIGGERLPEIAKLGNKNWDRIALSRMSYGYTTKIPPMSTLAIYNAIANDGKYVRPRLVKELMRNGVTDSIIPVSYIREQVCTPDNARKLRQMLNAVVWGDHGTAKVLRNDKVNISGKTGTCFAIEGKHYNTSVKRLAFCGFFPYENPQYTCMVLMFHADRGAARCSGTVLKNVALKLYSRGMLGNSSDLSADTRADKSHVGQRKTSTMYASRDVKRQQSERKTMGIRNANRFRSPLAAQKGTVPSALGLGLRDAINVMEEAGFTVNFNGTGYVVAQSLQPGDPLPPNKNITLILKN